jgi:hypothetical protein
MSMNNNVNKGKVNKDSAPHATKKLARCRGLMLHTIAITKKNTLVANSTYNIVIKLASAWVFTISPTLLKNPASREYWLISMHNASSINANIPQCPINTVTIMVLPVTKVLSNVESIEFSPTLTSMLTEAIPKMKCVSIAMNMQTTVIGETCNSFVVIVLNDQHYQNN